MSDSTVRTLPCSEDEPALGWIARHSGPWLLLVWLPIFLTIPLVDAVRSGNVGLIGLLLGIGVSCAVGVMLPYRVDSRRWPAECALIAHAAFTVLYLMNAQGEWGLIFPLLAVTAAIAVRRRLALVAIVIVALNGALISGAASGETAVGLSIGITTFLTGFGNFVMQYLVGVITELRVTRQKLAQVAVAEERQRFSRDLHDILGHTLSVVVVKSEAIRRLASRDPAAAAAHAADIEDIGRDALTQVREAVSGYRSMSLSGELDNSRSALAAGGVEAVIHTSVTRLDSDVDTILGWVVREATTNVLRHAVATRCLIDVATHDGIASVEIIDDGRGTGTAAEQGSGLRGLHERIDRVGGSLVAAGTPGGFRLAATVPVVSEDQLGVRAER